MNFVRQDFRKLSSDKQTDRQTVRRTDERNYRPRRFAGGQQMSTRNATKHVCESVKSVEVCCLKS